MKKILEQLSGYLESVSFITSKIPGFYIGWIGKNNLGDEVLFHAVKELFPAIHFREQVFIGKSLKLLPDRVKYIFLGGGTLIGNQVYLDHIIELGNVFPNAKKIAFGTGVRNPIYWNEIKPSLKRWAKALDSFDFVGVRGQRSYDILREYGVAANVNIIGDPALLFCEDSITAKKKNKVLGLNIGKTGFNDMGELWGHNEPQFIETMVHITNTLIQKGWEIKLFPVWEKDIPLVEAFAQRLSKTPYILRNFMSREQFMAELHDVDVFVGEKLHSVILACCTYTPSIMLEYRPKCLDFMESVNLGHNTIRTDCVTEKNLIDLIEKCYAQLEEEQNALYSNVNRFKNTLINASQSVMKLL